MAIFQRRGGGSQKTHDITALDVGTGLQLAARGAFAIMLKPGKAGRVFVLNTSASILLRWGQRRWFA